MERISLRLLFRKLFKMWLGSIKMVTYIFGYGSLISKDSRERTGITGASFPVKVKGLKRSWNVIIADEKTVALGIEKQEGACCNGVIFEIPDSELASFDSREGDSYSRVRLLSQDIEVEEDVDFSDCDIWVYLTKNKGEPSSEFQIQQSYIDVILTGCLEMGEKFASEFMNTTHGWNFIEDDRMEPKYPRFLEKLDWKDEIDCLLLGVK